MLIYFHISTSRLPFALKYELQIACINISVLRSMTPCAIGNNKKTEAAESAAACVGTCYITNVDIEEVHLRANNNGNFIYVICWFYWCVWDNNVFCLFT